MGGLLGVVMVGTTVGWLAADAGYSFGATVAWLAVVGCGVELIVDEYRR